MPAEPQSSPRQFWISIMNLQTASNLLAVGFILVYLWPVMPGTMARGYCQLGLGDIAATSMEDLETFAFPEGVRVSKGSPLFPRKE